MSRRASLAVLALAAALPACVVDAHHQAPPTETTIRFGESTNIGYVCGGGAAFSWTVTARETQDTGTAGCQQPIDFVGYAPGATYTFDVEGYDGTDLCWKGTCSVTAQAVDVTYADCSSQIAHLCGL